MTPTPTLELAQGRPVCTSRAVAQHFGKKHKHVLDAIAKIIIDTDPDFNGPNFRPVGYLDAKGEQRPAYQMTRDGFSLLAMGFTGKRALAWKVKYIKAFNAMEAYITRERELLALRDRLPSIEDIRMAANYHLTRLAHAHMMPDHPEARGWEREARAFQKAALGLN